MATSGSINFLVTSNDIITDALEILGVLGEGESPTADQTTSSQRTLNMMVKAWQGEGLNLFAVRRQYLFLNKDQREYTLSSTTTDHFTSSFVETTVDVDASATDTTIIVDDATGISNGDNIGIFIGSNTMQWTTVNGAPVGTTITLTDPLAADVSAGALVYSYANKANRPMKIMEAYTHIFNETDIPTRVISRVDYYELSNKGTSGVVTQVYYDPQINAGNLFVWPTAVSERDYLIFLSQRTLEDFDNSTDNPDYPQEWFMALAYNLALYLAPKYGIPVQDYQRIERQASYLYEQASGFDSELYTSMYLKPDTWGQDLPS